MVNFGQDIFLNQFERLYRLDNGQRAATSKKW